MEVEALDEVLIAFFGATRLGVTGRMGTFCGFSSPGGKGMATSSGDDTNDDATDDEA